MPEVYFWLHALSISCVSGVFSFRHIFVNSMFYLKSLIWSWCNFRYAWRNKKKSIISLTRLRLDFNVGKIFNFMLANVLPVPFDVRGMSMRVCVCARGSFKRWPFVCSHGKEWIKGGSAGYFGAGGDANAKGPFTAEHVISWSWELPCHRGGPGPPTSTESPPGWAVSAEERIRPSTLATLVKRAC